MPKNALTLVVSSFRPVYELVYPPTCLSCDRYLVQNAVRICPECWSRIRKLTPDDKLYREKLAQLLGHGNISGFASAFHFEKDGVLQNLIHRLKYRESTRVGLELGKFINDALSSMLPDVAFDAIVPIPLHPARERERGYNQSEIICRGVSRSLDVPTRALLKRIRHTKTQTKLDAHERKENVSGAFGIKRRYMSFIPHKSILLIDDIITTGATVNECAGVLKHYGAAAVYAASIGLPDHTHLP